jgi:hypothetical protein
MVEGCKIAAIKLPDRLPVSGKPYDEIEGSRSFKKEKLRDHIAVLIGSPTGKVRWA